MIEKLITRWIRSRHQALETWSVFFLNSTPGIKGLQTLSFCSDVAWHEGSYSVVSIAQSYLSAGRAHVGWPGGHPPPLLAGWDKSWKTTNVWQSHWAPTHNDWLKLVSPTAMCFFSLSHSFSKAVLHTWSASFRTVFQWQDDDTGRGQWCETADQKEAEEGKCLEIRGTQGRLCHGLCPHVRSERCKKKTVENSVVSTLWNQQPMHRSSRVPGPFVTAKPLSSQ